MKKLIAFVLAMLMLASFTACGTSAGSSEPAAVDIGLAEGKTVTEFLDAFQAHFEGLALDPIDDALLQDIYMVNPENVESYEGRMSMMNVQAFDVLVVKAKEGKVEEVKASLEERKQNRIAEFEFYPVNNNDVHTQNALVLTSGDYAILVICNDYEGVQPILDEYFTKLA